MDSLFGDKLEKLLSNEQTMGKIREIANSLSGSGGPEGAPPPPPPPPPPPKPGGAPDCPPKNDLRPPPSRIGGYCAILAAIKPYFDSERRERIDKMIRVLRIAETAKTFIGI